MDPAAAAEVLRRTLEHPERPMTVADASVASGLALRDTEAGLTWLTSEYRGHLRVTEDGDLLHFFPHGFRKPWERSLRRSRALRAAGRAALAAGRFIVRAWLLIAMLGYAVALLALIVGLTVARQGGDRDGASHGLSIVGALFRAIGDALFWTFHPFSPLSVVHRDVAFGRRRRSMTARSGRDADDVPFYEKVNRFVFGASEPPDDPHVMRSLVLQEIRAQRGRVGLADVMRVTGLPRDEADPLMARLMLDHDGDVEVAEGGGIVYRFEGMRRSAGEARARRPPPAWDTRKPLPPLTGNSAGANIGIALLNGWNLLASASVMSRGLTLSNIALLFSKHPPPVLPDDGVPLVLGLVPFLFSLTLFVLPMIRALLRLRAERDHAVEGARLGILREVLSRAPRKQPVTDAALRDVWRVATGNEPSSKEITARVVELGGDVDVGPEGEVRYRFAELEADAEALDDERREAPDAEARLGKVIFATDE